MASIIFKEGSYGFFAERDYNALQTLLQVKGLQREVVCFSCQQCIEKYLKHVARFNGHNPDDPLLHVHNLVRLAADVGYPHAAKYKNELLSLGKLYYEGRYPNEDESYMFVEPTPQEVKQAVIVVNSVREWVLSVTEQRVTDVKDSLKKMDLF